MRRILRRKVPTNKQSMTTAGQRGSVTLEAAVVLPLFLILALFVVFLVQTSVTAMALHGAITQTVRLAASAWYPVDLLQGAGETAGEAEPPLPGNDSGGIRMPDSKAVRDTIGEYGEWLPPPLNEWAEAIGEGRWTLEEEAAKVLFGRLAMSLADSQVLAAERFRLVSVRLPDRDSEAVGFLTLEGEYRLPFRVPFTERPLAIRAKARERVWTGGLPSEAALTEQDGPALDVRFVSLSPDPVRPGRKATLVLRTKPGAVLDLTVIYKSGKSQAKHLGHATADDSGLVSWTWHVSGNTASGQWKWVVRGEGGSYEQSFRVERNPK